MKKILLINFILLLAISIFAMSKSGGVTKSFDGYEVEGVKLKEKNEVQIFQLFSFNSFNFDSSYGEVNLVGIDGDECNLTITYYEYKKDDANLFLENGEIQIKTLTENPAIITKIEGTIPMNVNLNIETGFGDIIIENMQNMIIEGETGYGDISISGMKNLDKVDVDTGYGDIDIFNIDSANGLYSDTGKGDIFYENINMVDRIDADTGFGSIEYHKVVAGHINSDTGFGSIKIVDSNVSQIDADTGFGNIVLQNTETESQSCSSGFGKVKIRD